MNNKRKRKRKRKKKKDKYLSQREQKTLKFYTCKPLPYQLTKKSMWIHEAGWTGTQIHRHKTSWVKSPNHRSEVLC
jgi:hypothetical protein